MCLYAPVGALPPQYLLGTNFFIAAHLSEIKPREMLRSYVFNPRKLCLFEVNWLKRFFLFTAALEKMHCKDLDLFFLSILL